jgi:hypothetical protein
VNEPGKGKEKLVRYSTFRPHADLSANGHPLRVAFLSSKAKLLGTYMFARVWSAGFP